MAQNPTSTAALNVVVFPGASLMEIQPVSKGLTRVRCPGCGASQLYTPGPPGVANVAFVHEDDQCPVFLRIKSLLASAPPEIKFALDVLTGMAARRS